MLATCAALLLAAATAAGERSGLPPEPTAAGLCRADVPCRSPRRPRLWRVPYEVAAARRRLAALELWAPAPRAGLLVARPVPSVVSLEAQQFSDALEEDGCLGWHAQSRLNARTRGLRWLTVDQAAIASLHPGHCNGTIGLDLAGLAAGGEREP